MKDQDIEFVEYRVRPVTRYVVTRYARGTVDANDMCVGESSEYGEFAGFSLAEEVAFKLSDHERENSSYAVSMIVE